MTPSMAKKVWAIDRYLDSIPADTVKSYKAFVVSFMSPILPFGGIGVDPGLRLGLSYIEAEDVAFTLAFSINRTDLSSQELMDVIHKTSMLIPDNVGRSTPVVVEGPAHGARYGQALLGAVRGGLILSFHNAAFESVSEVAPKRIRARTFGDGEIQPKHFWQHVVGGREGLSKDAVDALSMAICAGI